MNSENQLQQVIDLIKKTGDKVIVLAGDKPSYVLMTIKDYERLILGKSEVRGLTEDELLDKINREIAVWKSEQERIKEIEDEYSDLKERARVEDFSLDSEFPFQPEGEDWKEEEIVGAEEQKEDFEIPEFEIPDFDPSTFSAGSEAVDRSALPRSSFDSEEPRFEEDKYYVEPME